MADKTAQAYLAMLASEGYINEQQYNEALANPDIQTEQDAYAWYQTQPTASAEPPPAPVEATPPREVADAAGVGGDAGIGGFIGDFIGDVARLPEQDSLRQIGGNTELVGGFSGLFRGDGEDAEKAAEVAKEKEEEEQAAFDVMTGRAAAESLPVFVWDYITWGDIDFSEMYDVIYANLPKQMLPPGWKSPEAIDYLEATEWAADGTATRTAEQYKQETIAAWLGTAGEDDPIVQVALETYGTWSDRYKPDMTDGGFKVSDINQVAQAFGITYEQARHFGAVGRLSGLSLAESASLFQFLERNGVIDPNEGRKDLRSPGEIIADNNRKAAEARAAATGDDSYLPEAAPAGRPPTGDEKRDAFRERGRRQNAPGRFDDAESEWDKFEFGYSFGDAAFRFERAKDMFANSTVAQLWVVNEDLAERLFSNPYSFTAQELQKLVDVMGGFEAFQALDPGGANWVARRLEGGKDIVQVDMDGAREAARTLAAAWNMPDMPDSFIEQVARGVAAPQVAAYKAMMGNPFNPQLSQGPSVMNVPSATATAERLLRQTDLYQELFSHNVWGENEEMYAGRMSDEAQSLLGNAATPANARAGMRTGDINTIGQQAVFSGEGYGSSRFQERLAQLRQVWKQEM
jgi:hypothetical protein